MLAQVPNLQQIQSNAGINLSFTGIGGLISNTLPYILGAAAIALLIYLIFGGFQLMLSRGDPKAIQSAQSKITSALIGFVIVVIAYTLTGLIGQLLGIGIFTQVFK